MMFDHIGIFVADVEKAESKLKSILPAKRSQLLNHVAYPVSAVPWLPRNLRSTGAAPTGPPRPAVAFGGAKKNFFLRIWIS